MMKLSFILCLYITIVYAHLFSDDPDLELDVKGLAKLRGSEAIPYEVTTEDGYILTIFRIVSPNIKHEKLKSRPVVLWHGILQSATIWISSRDGIIKDGIYSEDNFTVFNDCKVNLTSTLGFTLSACGYDVWLANSRGNTYSAGHKNLTIHDSKYWEFTLTEVALYDVPATIKEILRITKKKCLSFIGHSMGTTIAFILLSLKPEYADLMRPYIALSPVVYLKNVKSILRFLAPLVKIPFIQFIAIGLEVRELPLIAKYICGNSDLVELCYIVYGLLFGFDRLNTDFDKLPSLYSHIDRTSSRILFHYFQLINNGGFAQFDYGEIKNKEIYNQIEPPSYPLKDIRAKHIYFEYGANDLVADPTDVKRLYNEIPGLSYLRENPWPFWNHGDFVIGKFARTFQNPSILKILGKYDNEKCNL